MQYLHFSLASVNLKNSQLFYQQKWDYSGIAENCTSTQASYGKTIGKSGEPKRQPLFYRGKGPLAGLFEAQYPLASPGVPVSWLPIG